uniref:hypothetical protein n=1 Tax=Arcanobacterium phocae TaxID=131112 RepID=UPI001C0EC0F5
MTGIRRRRTRVITSIAIATGVLLSGLNLFPYTSNDGHLLTPNKAYATEGVKGFDPQTRTTETVTTKSFTVDLINNKNWWTG